MTVRLRRRSRALLTMFVTSALTTLVGAAHAATSSGIVVETVSDYTLVSGGSHGNDTDANTEGDGFVNAITAAGTGYTTLKRFKDNSVYDTDFFDPDLTGTAGDNDTTNFDPAGAAISLFIGHGTCEDVSASRCTTDSDCGIGGYCPGQQLSAGEVKTCIFLNQRRLITSSSGSKHGNSVWYGSSLFGGTAKSLALGDDGSSGGFGGAGTNGGTNVAIIVNSCGIRSHYYMSQTQNFYAGVHSVMMTMPINSYLDSSGAQKFSDTSQWAARGSTLANNMLTNLLAPASDAWFNPTMTSSGFTFGHRQGANIVMSRDATASLASWHVHNESWLGAKLESNDAVGNGAWSAAWACNYDCNTFGF